MQTTAKSTFMRGVRDVFPILFGALPFGIVVGVVSAEVGFSAFQTIIESSGIFAGASQLVMLDLLGKDAAMWVIVISAGILNLRHVIYSASLAPHYKERSTLWKILLSFVMVDQVYALGIAHHTDNPDSAHKHWYHMGLAVPLVIIWSIATIIGYFLGAIIPASWSLTFVIPLMFLALLVPAVKERSYFVAAIASAIVALLTVDLPHNLGLMLATLAGIMVGFMLSSRDQEAQR